MKITRSRNDLNEHPHTHLMLSEGFRKESCKVFTYCCASRAKFSLLQIHRSEEYVNTKRV